METLTQNEKFKTLGSLKFEYTVPKNLLSKHSSNAKTKKNKLKSYILYLSPHTLNSKKINLCPFASNGCIKSCLYESGFALVYSSVNEHRRNRTEYYIQNRTAFLTQLATELIKINRLNKSGKKIAIRLNGTSDRDFVKELKTNNSLNIEHLNNLIFYDYTKNLHMALKYKGHPNYKITFSKSETNEEEVNKALKLGLNVAIVFKGSLPETYKGFKVVDGDASDLEMLKYNGVILGLKAKGKAKKDESGFVIDNSNNLKHL